MNLENISPLMEGCGSCGCGGFKGCLDREFDHTQQDCEECRKDADQAMEELQSDGTTK